MGRNDLKNSVLLQELPVEELYGVQICVVKSKIVLKQLEKELREKKVVFKLNQKSWQINPKIKEIYLKNSEKISYSHFINCAGLRADEVAQKFGLGRDYTLIPFKGIYWEIKSKLNPLNDWMSN